MPPQRRRELSLCVARLALNRCVVRQPSLSPLRKRPRRSLQWLRLRALPPHPPLLPPPRPLQPRPNRLLRSLLRRSLLPRHRRRRPLPPKRLRPPRRNQQPPRRAPKHRRRSPRRRSRRLLRKRLHPRQRRLQRRRPRRSPRRLLHQPSRSPHLRRLSQQLQPSPLQLSPRQRRRQLVPQPRSNRVPQLVHQHLRRGRPPRRRQVSTFGKGAQVCRCPSRPAAQRHVGFSTTQRREGGLAVVPWDQVVGIA